MFQRVMIALFVMLAHSGCSSGAALIRRDAGGGRVQLQGAYMPAMADARLLMTGHCRGRYDAVQRGTTVAFRCRDARRADEI